MAILIAGGSCDFKYPVLQVWGFIAGLITRHKKKELITETNDEINRLAGNGVGAASICIPDEDYISAEDRTMMEVGESRKEAYSGMKMFTHPREKLKIGCWNVRTMYSIGKTAQVCREMRRYKIDVLGISECRWLECGKVNTIDHEVIIYSGKNDKHEYGVAIILSKNAAKSLMSWKPVSDRIITARMYSKYIKATIVQTYAPQNESTEEEKNKFYEQLQKVYDEIPKHDMIISMGDWNAKIGFQMKGEEGIVGRHVLKGDRTDSGARFVSSCEVNNMAIVSTMFPHKNIHKYTWNSPDGITRNQIDHISINGAFRRSVSDVRVYREADADSDHNLVVGTIKLKLASTYKKKENRNRYNNQNLKLKEVKQKFTIEIKNRFNCLEEISENSATGGIHVIEQKWKKFKQIYNETAEKVLGFQKGKNKPWISDESWKKIDERKGLKKKVEDAKSQRIKEMKRIKYREKALEVKKCLQHDKRKWADDIAREAETAFQKGNMRGVYDCTKKLCNSKQRRMDVIKDKNGKLLSTENEVLQRWKEHFMEILNRPDPDTLADVNTEGVEELDVSSGSISKEEIRSAIKDLKSNKAPGSDNITAEILKADVETTVNELEKLFKIIWESEEVPEDWKEGLIVKLPKKGDLTRCGNWRGLTLMSIPAKLLGRTIVRRLQEAVDVLLRKEQAGFRKHHGTSEQIFILRNIVEQSLEWNATMYLIFVDYEKAFDSINRETLWKIMKSYGIPQKFIMMVKAFYRNSKVAVLHGGKKSEWFEVKSGVKQGCVMSGLLFLLVIDWIMRRTLSEGRLGIRWRMMETLEDLDYADDIVLLAETWRNAQQKLDRLNGYGLQTGLKINVDKTESLRIMAKNNTPFKVNNKDIEDVASFTYLGATITTSGGAQEDMKIRIGKARKAYYCLKKIWSSGQYRRKTKMRIFQSNVLSVLLYGCETWKMTEMDEQCLNVFVHKCLRRILKIYWPTRMSNEEVCKIAKIVKVSTQIRKRRWRNIGHILRMSPESHQRTALRWTPDGRRNRGRPKETWRRTVEKELKSMKLTSWEATAAAANDRNRWRDLINSPALHIKKK